MLRQEEEFVLMIPELLPESSGPLLAAPRRSLASSLGFARAACGPGGKKAIDQLIRSAAPSSIAPGRFVIFQAT
jgi:hypothetical protein